MDLGAELGLQLDHALGPARVDRQLVARVAVAENEPVDQVLIILELCVSCTMREQALSAGASRTGDGPQEERGGETRRPGQGGGEGVNAHQRGLTGHSGRTTSRQSDSGDLGTRGGIKCEDAKRMARRGLGRGRGGDWVLDSRGGEA